MGKREKSDEIAARFCLAHTVKFYINCKAKFRKILDSTFNLFIEDAASTAVCRKTVDIFNLKSLTKD